MKRKAIPLFLLVLCICMTCSGCKANKDQVEQPADVEEPVVAEDTTEIEEAEIDGEEPAVAEDTTEIEEVETVEQLFEEINVSMWASSGVNVRSEYSKDSEKLGRLSTGDKITVTGKGINEAKNWYRIEFKGKTGYVSKKYLMDTKVKKPSPQSDKAISTVVQSDDNSSSKPSNNGSSKPSSGSNNSSSKPSGGSSSSKPSGGRVPHGDASQFGSAAGKGGTIIGEGFSDTDPADEDTSGWH